jgi:molecular chaperone GrpE
MPETDTPPAVPALSLIATPALTALETQAAQAAQFREGWARAQADLDNYRKRAAREKDEARKFANEGFVESLLPVIDSFELGIQSSDGASDPAAVAQGMKMALSLLFAALRENGVEPVDALNQPFDPHLHEAVSHETTADSPDGTVVKQLRKGWKLKDRLLRPASVIVARAPEPASA